MLKKKMIAKLDKILKTAESFGLVLGSGTLRFRFTRGVLRISDRTINTSNSAAWTDISPNSAFRNETNHWLNTSTSPSRRKVTVEPKHRRTEAVFNSVNTN